MNLFFLFLFGNIETRVYIPKHHMNVKLLGTHWDQTLVELKWLTWKQVGKPVVHTTITFVKN